MVAKQNATTVLASLSSWTVDLNQVTNAISGGVIGGLVVGGLARLAMRGVALIAGKRPEFSLTGTFGILLLFAILGALLAMPYLGLRRWLPVHSGWTALLYGALLAGLAAWPFFQTSDGEFAIVAAWLGAALFSPLPLVYSATLEIWLRRQAQRGQPVRRVAWYWFVGCLLSLVFVFVRIMNSLDSYTRTPATLQTLYRRLGSEFGAMQELNGLIGFLIALLYCSLCALLFRNAFNRPAGAAAAVTLLLLAGLIMPANPVRLGLRAEEAGAAGEWLTWGLALLIVTGSLWLARRVALPRSAHPPYRTLAWLAAAIGLSAGAFLLMWASILLVPGLQLRRLTGWQTALATPLFWWPWLLGPLTLLYAVRRRL